MRHPFSTRGSCALLAAAALLAVCPSRRAASQEPLPMNTPAAHDPLQTLHAANQSIRRLVLDNGLTVLLKHDGSAPLVAVQYWVRSGAIHEAENLGGGLSHFLEHMVFKGTPTRDPARVSKDIADAGGDINAYTSSDRTVFHASLPARNWQVALDVLTDAVFTPSFPEDEWRREREVILRECDMNDDNPDRMMSRILWETVYQVHPYRVPVIGWRDILTTMTRDHLVAYHRDRYSPHNAILAVVGDVSLDDMEAAIRARVASIPRTPVAPVFIPPEPPQAAERRTVRSGPYQTTRLAVAFHSTALMDPDTAALDVLASAVGSGKSSLLNRRLHEELRLAHSIEAFNYTPQYPGVFAISAVCDPENAAALEAAIRAEVERWKAEPFDPAVIDRAVRELLSSSIGELATMEGQAASMASGEFHAHNPALDETYLARLAAVTPDDLARVARQYLSLDSASWALLVPETEKPGHADAAAAPAADASAPAAPASPADAFGIQLHTLPNGLRVILRPTARLPLAAVAAVIGGGQSAEPDGQAGVASLVSSLLTAGTPSADAMQIAQRLEQKAAWLSPFAGRNTYGLTGGCLADDLPLLLDTLADCLLHASFPADEADKHRAAQLASLRQAQEKPMFHAQQLVRETLFRGHPFQYPALGTLDSIPALTSDHLAAYHRRLLSTTNLVLSLAGDFDPADVLARLQALFAELPDLPAPVPPPLPPPPAEPVTLTRRLPFLQTVIFRAWPGLSIPDPRETAADVLADALSGLSSDLFIEVRDKRGLAYYTAATQFHTPVGGLFAIYAGTTLDGAPEVLAQIDLQTRRLSADGIRPDEFARAKAQLLADDARSLQSYAGLAQECATDELLGLGYVHSLSRAAELEALTPADIAATAASLFDPSACVTAIVLPEAPAPDAAGADDADDADDLSGEEDDDETVAED
ncbi:MAG: insulinase family protein [Kiritimatiellae bacterium]|nr:insulinase family protein [Kiritimatiellia bacterium]